MRSCPSRISYRVFVFDPCTDLVDTITQTPGFVKFLSTHPGVCFSIKLLRQFTLLLQAHVRTAEKESSLKCVKERLAYLLSG